MHPLLEMARNRIVIFDGAMGTVLMASGLGPGESPELWNIEKPSLVMKIHRQYYEAGAQVVHTNTFGANQFKLADRGLSDKMRLLNMEAAKIARKACPEGKFVAGDLGPTGKLLKPIGDMSAEAAEDGYHKQADALFKGGVDLISIETMFSLEEALCALRGAKKLGNVLVSVSLTYNRTKKGFFTMMGEGVEKAVSTLEGAGADIIGANCTLGSKDMIELTKELRAATTCPILIQPNAGQPKTRSGITTYKQTPSEFASDAKQIRAAGANMIGGCCGTNAEFIRELARAVA